MFIGAGHILKYRATPDCIFNYTGITNLSSKVVYVQLTARRVSFAFRIEQNFSFVTCRLFQPRFCAGFKEPHVANMATASVTFKWDDRADELAKEALAKQTGAAWQNLQTYCLKMGYFEKLNVHASQIVCAPSNRDTYGCNGHDTHDNIDNVTNGWSDSFFEGIITDVDVSEREEVLQYNETMVAASKGQLAEIVRELIKFMTLAGSHTTQGFRQQHFKLQFQNYFPK